MNEQEASALASIRSLMITSFLTTERAVTGRGKTVLGIPVWQENHPTSTVETIIKKEDHNLIGNRLKRLS